MAVYEIEIDGQKYQVDDSTLGNYVNPKTGELEIDVVANELRGSKEQPNTGMNEETAQMFADANEQLKQIDAAIHPRGSNFGGGARALAMGAVPFSADIEGGIRAMSADKDDNFGKAMRARYRGDEEAFEKYYSNWEDLKDKYVKNAFESRQGFAAANPVANTALQITGGLASALIPFGAAAKAGGFGSALGRSMAAGAEMGALYGAGNAQGSLEDRLGDAAMGASFGLVGGTAAPILAQGAGSIRNIVSRLRGGFKELPQQQIEAFTLSKALAPTTESRNIASTLGLASQAGAKDIEKAGYQLLNSRLAMDEFNVPRLYTGVTEGGTTAKNIVEATKHPSMVKASKDFGSFVESIPTLEQPTKPLSYLLSNNKTALSVLEKDANAFTKVKSDGSIVPLDPSTFEYWQKAESVLRNRLPKKFDPNKLSPAKKDVYDAMQNISKTRENLFPGTQKINLEYKSAVADQKVLDNEVKNRLRTISSPEAQRSLPGGAVPTIGWLFGPARQRGIARELIKTGRVRPTVEGKGYRSTGAILDSIIRALQHM